jgi:hypothetical protein
MSDERRKRQQDREGDASPNPLNRKAGLLLLIAVIAVGLFAFIHHQQGTRYKAFAQCLSDKGAKMYGAYWCPHCADQKELFGASFQYVNYTECGIKGSRSLAQVCTDANVQHFPTWVFADGSRVEGKHELEFLSQETGCALP